LTPDSGVIRGVGLFAWIFDAFKRVLAGMTRFSGRRTSIGIGEILGVIWTVMS